MPINVLKPSNLLHKSCQDTTLTFVLSSENSAAKSCRSYRKTVILNNNKISPNFCFVIFSLHLARFEPLYGHNSVRCEEWEFFSTIYLTLAQQLVQIFAKLLQSQASKIRWRRFQLAQRIMQVFQRAMLNTALPLMMGRRCLNQALHKVAPRLVMALPDFFPCLVRLPKLTVIEQLHTLTQIG